MQVFSHNCFSACGSCPLSASITGRWRGEERGGSDVAEEWGLPPWWKWTRLNFNSHLSQDSADANQTVWIDSTSEANAPKMFTDLLLVDETFFFNASAAVIISVLIRPRFPSAEIMAADPLCHICVFRVIVCVLINPRAYVSANKSQLSHLFWSVIHHTHTHHMICRIHAESAAKAAVVKFKASKLLTSSKKYRLHVSLLQNVS